MRMVTGDNIHTAKHIARECGIMTEDGIAMEGPDFRMLTNDELMNVIPTLDVLARSAASLAELADAAMTSYPQVMRNVGIGTRVENPAAALSDEIAGAEAELGEEGRVLIRASGTEPLIRVMVEASTESEAERVCTRLSNVVAERFGPGQ